MDAVIDLGAIIAKDSWSAEDIRLLQNALTTQTEVLAAFRDQVSQLTAANPSPQGAVAVKLGVANYLLGRTTRALELLAVGTDNKERRMAQAMAFRQQRQYDKALEALQYAEDRGWDAKEANVLKAELLALSGRAAEARKIVDKLANSMAGNADYQYVAGLTAEMLGDGDQAVAAYQQARQICPGHPAATFRMAYYADLHGDEETAVELYRQCVTETSACDSMLSPRAVYANALLNLSVLLEDYGKYDEATRLLRRLLMFNPDFARARLYVKDVQASRTMSFDEDEAKRIARRNDLLAIPVTDFELSVRARNCLKKMNIRTLGDLLHVTEPELLSYKNFGETSLAEIKSMLASKGLRLGQSREEAAGGIPLTAPTAAAPTTEQGASVGNEGVLGTLLSQIEFSVRARKALERLNVKTIGDLAAKTEAELLACRNFGQTSLNEVRQRLGEYGLHLREG